VNKSIYIWLGKSSRDFNSGALTYLIQHSKTREYFHDGDWTLDSHWAEEFSDLAKAITACLRHELRDVELVLRFGLEFGRSHSLQLAMPEGLLAAVATTYASAPRLAR
jgi:hypothetical protein